MNEYLKASLEVSQKASRVLRENQFGNLNLKFKGEIDIVTAMDKKSEEDYYPIY